MPDADKRAELSSSLVTMWPGPLCGLIGLLEKYDRPAINASPPQPVIYGLYINWSITRYPMM